MNLPPLGQHVYSAAIVAALYLLFVPIAIWQARTRHFRLYILIAVSATLRGVGFALKGSTLDNFGIGKTAVYFAFQAAGFGITIAVLSLILGCWFKNAHPEHKPAAYMRLSVGVRLLIAPIFTFGPVLGVAGAVLIYGDGSEDALDKAAKIRKATAWGLWGIVVLLTLLTCYALLSTLVGLRRRREELSVAKVQPHAMEMLLLLAAACLLIVWSATIRVVTQYKSDFSYKDRLYYTLVSLPELCELTILLFPGILVRMCMAENHDAFVAAGGVWPPPVVKEQLEPYTA